MFQVDFADTLFCMTIRITRVVQARPLDTTPHDLGAGAFANRSCWRQWGNYMRNMTESGSPFHNSFFDSIRYVETWPGDDPLGVSNPTSKALKEHTHDEAWRLYTGRQSSEIGDYSSTTYGAMTFLSGSNGYQLRPIACSASFGRVPYKSIATSHIMKTIEQNSSHFEGERNAIDLCTYIWAIVQRDNCVRLI